MTDPRDAEPYGEVAGEIRLSFGGEDDSATQEESTVREEPTAALESGFDPADSRTVEDFEPHEIAGMMVNGRMSDDMYLSEVPTSKEGLSLSADVDRPTSDPAPLEATAEEPRELIEVEVELGQRWPETKIDPPLERIEVLMDILGHPERAILAIHVAGTNGKTSTVRTVKSLARALGRRIGRITSPHLQLVTERIVIDGQFIHPHDYVRTWCRIRPYVEAVNIKSAEKSGLQMSRFEVLTAMAYAAFADAPVDIVVVEVGMGGTWDVINVVEADAAAIRPIGLDHTEYPSDTLAEIAFGKAGVIKSRWNKGDLLTPPGNVAIVDEQEPEAMNVTLRRAVEMSAPVTRAGAGYGVVGHQLIVGGQNLTLKDPVGEYDDTHLPLHDPHQARNAAVALATVEAFSDAGPGHPPSINTVRGDFATVASPGRLEHMHSTPTVFINAAHNPHGARALRTVLSAEFDFRRVTGVLSVLREKDVRGLLVELKPYFEEVVIIQNTPPCALHYDDLADLAGEIFDEGYVHRVSTLLSAAKLAVALAEETDTGDGIVSGSGMIVTGPVVTAGEARTPFGKDPQ